MTNAKRETQCRKQIKKTASYSGKQHNGSRLIPAKKYDGMHYNQQIIKRKTTSQTQ